MAKHRHRWTAIRTGEKESPKRKCFACGQVEILGGDFHWVDERVIKARIAEWAEEDKMGARR